MAKKSRPQPSPSNLPRVAVAPASEDGPNRKVRKEEARRKRELLLRRAARRRFYRWGVAGAVVVATLVVGTVLVLNKGSSSPTSTPSSPAVLADLQKGPAPWSQGVPGLKERLQAIDLPYGPQEQLAYHIHMHVEVFIDGTAEPVPAGVGINNVGPSSQQFITVLHTHDTSGIIHVESPVQRAYTLGQFFDVWGVQFSSTCVGGYCTSGNKQVRVFLNGKPYAGDPRGLLLKQHEEIVVTYGTKTELPTPIPSDYSGSISSTCQPGC
jgi:hypothetical protein